MLDESDKFAPSQSVRIMQDVNEPFKVIAQLETKGTVGQGIPSLLEDMRKKAKEIGADAIIPTEESKEKVQQGIIYNPWLGGYQTIGGGNQPVVKALAIIFERSMAQRKAAYKAPSIINGGANFNLLTLTLGGYGVNAWIGKNRFRVVGDYYSVDIPSSLGGDGFNNGKIENAIRVGVDYFFTENLSGFYFGSGIQSGSYSFGHENSNSRGNWKTLDFTISTGYKLNFASNFELDTRIGLDAIMFGGEEIDIGGYTFYPLEAKPFASIGLGVNF
jgi:hypothetical protein